MTITLRCGTVTEITADDPDLQIAVVIVDQDTAHVADEDALTDVAGEPVFLFRQEVNASPKAVEYTRLVHRSYNG